MSTSNTLFYLQKGNINAIPILHYKMEMAAHVHQIFRELKPDCVAVELAETMQLQLMHAASRLPDISVIVSYDQSDKPFYYMCEPCDAAFEGLRCALEHHIPAFCIDLDVDHYPDIREHMPDPYAIQRIGLDNYFKAYSKLGDHPITPLDHTRELYMAKRLKELSFSYSKILFVGGMAHVKRIMDLIDRESFPEIPHAKREAVQLCTLNEESSRSVMGECGWFSMHYEAWRDTDTPPPDRQKMIFQLFKEASLNYMQSTGNAFPGYHLRNLMKFVRNYAFITGQLLPDLYQILSGAKGCVDHNYAYEVWVLATAYLHRRNIDNVLELDLSVEDVWGQTKNIRFHLKEPGRKERFFERYKKGRSDFRFQPPGPFSICSYPPEDSVIEKFGGFLKKKGTQLLVEEGARTIPFTSSLEDGLDTRETIRHWHEKKLYVKTNGPPPGGVGSVVVIFDEDTPTGDTPYQEKYPWHTTWLGEHAQESDMSFYATPLSANVVGPGISRCEYGGFMMSYPPRRMFNIWGDPDYKECRTKAEVLLMAAIDYAVKPLIVYVAAKAPRGALKSFARRFGKKIVYFPIGQLSPITLNKLRVFHVLDGRDRRTNADQYIF